MAFFPASARADDAPAAASAEAQAQAQAHYQRARDLYGTGNYKDALAELEAAQALDPGAKDLVFNLGVVDERLGKIDDALANFKRYLAMDLTPAERAKAEGYVKRLEGAKKQLDQGQPPPPPPTTPPDPQPEPEPERGRVDVVTIAAAAVAVVGLGVGTVLGVKALSDRPRNATTSDSFSYDQFVHQNDRAHTEAIVSDVGFVVGVAAGIAAAYLYFARPKVAPPPKVSTGSAVSTGWWGGPLRNGGAMMGLETRF